MMLSDPEGAEDTSSPELTSTCARSQHRTHFSLLSQMETAYYDDDDIVVLL